MEDKLQHKATVPYPQVNDGTTRVTLKEKNHAGIGGKGGDEGE